MNICRMRRHSLLLIGTGLSIALSAPGMAQVATGGQSQPGIGQTPPAPESASVDEQPTQQQAAAGEDIIVTGSRLARDPNLTAPSPVVTLNIADLRAAGGGDVTEVLRQVPSLISSGSVADSIERGGGGIGQATLNLRGLGSNRTLVLVNGQRHVSGVAGAQTVDVATIPRALIQNVEVLTGGASAIYGADAVTGVVNYVLRRDFSGIEISGQAGISERGDGLSYSFDAVFGRNFAEGRGNITIAGSYIKSEEVKTGDREWARGNQQATAGLTYPNPLFRFQQGEINPATMPNFASFYNVAAGRYPYGFVIPQPGTAAFNAVFAGGRTPTAAEQALIGRVQGIPSNVLAQFPNFAISSGSSLIGRADYRPLTIDSDGNGVRDCNDSYVGSVLFRTQFLGGCVISTPGGGIRPFRDGIVNSTTNQTGGDGSPEAIDAVSLLPETERYDINLLGRFEFSPAAEVFIEAKYVRTNTFSQPSAPNTFYDQLYIRPDNPFIPAVLRADATAAGGLLVSRDFYDIPVLSQSERDTYRIVAGVRGVITPNLNYQATANYGRTDNQTTGNSVLPDRLFAAIDVVTGPNGQPTCASNVNPRAVHPGSEFFPVITPGFFTFTPGANSGCVPANLFNGFNSVSPEAAAWIAQPTTSRARLQQLVLNTGLTGDTGGFFNMPGGPVQFAVGAEYREERSRSELDPLVLGLLPTGSPAGPAGTFVGTVDPTKQSLVFDTTTRSLNVVGRFDVVEAYGEISIPILRDRPFFEDLTVGGAARYSRYSTVGDTFTWNVNGVYSPVRDIRIRGAYAVAIRAPNIAELFSPQQGTVFRPIDPCNTGAINNLIRSGNAANVARGERRRRNCAADGIPVGFEDPLTARFSGTTGGNQNLIEESARTWTAGAVIQPRWIPGLSISGDYYDIEIEDAIAAVTAQNIVNSCYEAETFPNQFCDLFDRNGPTGAQAFGFNFLRQTQLNFGRFQTSGVDATVNYAFTAGDHNFGLRAAGNWTRRVNLFFDPANPAVVDPELGEQGYPEFSASGSVSWSFRGIGLGYRLQYIDRMALAGVEIERQDVEFGPAGTGPDYFIHDLTFNIEAESGFNLFGGVNNFTDRQPFINRASYPVSGMGRYFFVGARARF